MNESGRGGVLEQVRLELGKRVVLFRNQSGFVDRDKPCEHCGKRPTQHRGAERYGLAPGASDLIGIGPGGRFLALEVKAPGKKPTPEQRRFLELVARNDGFAGWCSSVERALVFHSECLNSPHEFVNFDG